MEAYVVRERFVDKAVKHNYHGRRCQRPEAAEEEIAEAGEIEDVALAVEVAAVPSERREDAQQCADDDAHKDDPLGDTGASISEVRGRVTNGPEAVGG